MRSIFFVVMLLLASCATQAQKSYTINGNIGGQADGMKVMLMTYGWTPAEVVDSTIIKDGKFTFKGAVAIPARYRIIIDKTPKGEESTERNWLASSFYLENSPITYSGHVDSLPTFYYNRKRVAKEPVIKGSATQDEAVAYAASMREMRKPLQALSDKYLEVYHQPAMEGKFNTKEGVAIVREEKALEKAIKQKKWQYIKDNPKSVIAYDQAMEYFYGMFVTLTVKEIEELTALVNRGWAGTENMKAFTAAAEKAKKTAIGTKYQDFEFLTPEGKKVMLSQYVPKGKYVMLEFWASWCGPCRGEIPHLRAVNEEKGNKFGIVSISLDEKDADWKKAMKEEGMVWTQLADPSGFEGNIAKAYNILGIPFSLLLDKEGRIMEVEMRGAYLDAVLEDLGI